MTPSEEIVEAASKVLLVAIIVTLLAWVLEHRMTSPICAPCENGLTQPEDGK